MTLSLLKSERSIFLCSEVCEVRADSFGNTLIEGVCNIIIGRATLDEENDGDAQDAAPHKLIGVLAVVYIF